ncbi:pyocin knob domain-containing protein [Ahrensia sp. R2A130]|uniref:pyocin knob domain-containing protein n=1 Tax=Ahrensia sp. R2A130 TaxID=744979 RepID=UPI0001E0B4FF|nr:pyocin knob domain-containing protein [Ahrensia sp. R2A130]EFL88269.1 hypothetical protein R2A130_3436 [Ahrensia sp. R2A130]
MEYWAPREKVTTDPHDEALVHENYQQGVNATGSEPDARGYEQIMRSLVYAVKEAGLPPDPNSVTLVWEAIQAAVAAGASSYTLRDSLGTATYQISDWNDATSNGWYSASNGANSPDSNIANWMGAAEVQNSQGWITQTAHAFTDDSQTNTMTYRREMNAGGWGVWYRVYQSSSEISELVGDSGADGVVVSHDPANLQSVLQQTYTILNLPVQTFANGDSVTISGNVMTIAAGADGAFNVSALVRASAKTYRKFALYVFINGVDMGAAGDMTNVNTNAGLGRHVSFTKTFRLAAGDTIDVRLDHDGSAGASTIQDAQLSVIRKGD